MVDLVDHASSHSPYFPPAPSARYRVYGVWLSIVAAGIRVLEGLDWLAGAAAVSALRLVILGVGGLLSLIAFSLGLFSIGLGWIVYGVGAVYAFMLGWVGIGIRVGAAPPVPWRCDSPEDNN